MTHKEAHYQPDADGMQALDLGRVLFVRDYVTQNHA